MPSASTIEELDLGRWTATPEFVDEYLSTLDDKCPVYQKAQVAPPIALAARTLAILIEKMDLPPGTVHTSQEIISQKTVAIGQEVSGGWQKRRGPSSEANGVFFPLRLH